MLLTTDPRPDTRIFTSKEAGPGWDANTSLVLIEGSATIVLQAGGTAANYGTPRWVVIRNPNDAVGLSMAPFPAQDLSLSTPTGLKTNMSTDAVGSFSVICYDDQNGNSQFDAGEPSCYFNVVVARVVPLANNSVTAPAANQSFTVNRQVLIAIDADPAKVDTGVLSAGVLGASDTMSLSGTIGVIGGAGDGMLGVDRVRSGWSNNLTGYRSVGGYPGQKTAPVIFNQSNALNPNFVVNNPTPALLMPDLTVTNPLLDTGFNPPGIGGKSICLTRSTEGNFQGQPLGQSRTTTATDTPGTTVLLVHPGNGTQLTSVNFAGSFSAYLVLWTEMTSGNLGDPGANLYSMVSRQNWEFQQNYTITYPASGLVATPAADNVNKVYPNQDLPQAAPLQGVGEVSGPIAVRRGTNRLARP